MSRVRLGWAWVATGLALLAALALAGPSLAHALPQSSDPGPGTTLATPPTRVSIIFGERPDPSLSSIKVLDTGGNAVTSGPTVAAPDDPLVLEVPLKPLGDGVYTVAWRTVSAVDGHLATGSYAFGVGASASAGAGPTSGAAVTASAGPSISSIVGRWLLYLGLVALLGVAGFGAVIAPASLGLTRRVLPGAWVLAALGTGSVIVVQLGEAGVSFDRVLQTSFGPVAVERIVALGALGLGVVLAFRGAGSQRAGPWVVAIAAAGALLADVLASHAAAGGAVVFNVLVQSTHVLAVALWLGGLVGLLVTILRTPGEETARAAKRFSRIATVGIAVVATSGLIRAIPEIGTVDGLVSTDFGHLVIAKTALLGVLALLGALNHFRNVPAAGRTLGGLRRAGSAELLVGATVLLLSASLVNLAPPAEAASSGSSTGGAPSPSPSPAPLVVEGHDFGTSVRVRLQVLPGAAGFNAFQATVTDYDTGAPVPASGVTLRFSIPSRPTVGDSRLDLAPAGSGVYRATGGNLSLEGAWQVTALVVQGSASVEVPFQVITRVAGQQVDVSVTAGLPTVKTVHLPAGRTVQVYLDPGRAGANELHVTFFDAAGKELPVESLAATLGPSGGLAAALTPRQLEPGHFVADVTLAAGADTLSISGPAPNGDVLTAQVDLQITP
jgi:copper transport protein